MVSERTYEVVVTVRHHDDSGSVDVQVSMRYADEPFTLLFDDTDANKRRGALREEVINMVRQTMRFAM